MGSTHIKSRKIEDKFSLILKKKNNTFISPPINQTIPSFLATCRGKIESRCRAGSGRQSESRT